MLSNPGGLGSLMPQPLLSERLSGGGGERGTQQFIKRYEQFVNLLSIICCLILLLLLLLLLLLSLATCEGYGS